MTQEKPGLSTVLKRVARLIPPILPPAHYRAGRKAAVIGFKREDCPYPVDSPERKLWEAGFDA